MRARSQFLMLFKNVASQKAVVFAYDKTSGAGKTGDASNITANVSKDGGAPSASNDTNPTEIGGGLYAFDLTQAETNCDLFALYAASGTSNILCNPVIGYTTGGAIPQAGVASQSSVTSAAGDVTSILADTGELQADWADGGRLDLILDARASQASVDAVDDFVDTEVGAIKTVVDAIQVQTDLIPAAPAAVSDIPTAVQNADALLNRDMSTGSDSGSATVRTPRQALRFLRNKWSLSGTTLTVTAEDDTTASWTAEVTTNASADPITASDPASS
jgi:hypothetical protein